MRLVHMVLFAAAVAVTSSIASAQSTGGVFGPGVTEGHLSANYRLAFDPDDSDLAQRAHVQAAINTRLMGRVLAQVRHPGSDTTEFDFVGAELFWQLTPDGSTLQTGVRFDGRLRGQGRPGFLGLNWTNQYNFNSQLHARFVVLGAIDVGSEARDGIFLQTRGRLNFRFRAGPQFGAELFSGYGSTADLRSFDDQSHQLGPHLDVPVGAGWSLFTSVLFGATEASDDLNLKLWVTKSF